MNYLLKVDMQRIIESPKTRLRITFVMPNIDVYGGNKIVLEYADFLASRQHKVTVVYPSKLPMPIGQRIRNLIRRRTWARPVPRASSLLAFLRIEPVRAKSIGKLLAADVPDADIVVATWWETAEWVNSFPDEKGSKVYFIQDHEIFEGLPKERVKETYLMPFKKVVVSRWLADTMARQYSDSSARLVRNGVDIDRFHDKSRKRTIPLTVGMLYSSVPRKNAELGIRAIIEARHALPTMKAIAFGIEPRPASIAGLEWVEYHCQPNQEIIPELYRRSHVWLFPSKSEGFGLPLLEAMASGTPVIATRAGAAPDLVDGNNGVLIDCKHQDMTREIMRIAAIEPNAWTKMSHHARATAEANNWLSAALEFEQAMLDVQSNNL